MLTPEKKCQYIYFQHINSRIMSDLSILAYGHQKYADFTLGVGPVIRSYNALHYILKGRGLYMVDGKQYTLQAGDIFFTPANVEVQYWSNKKDPMEYLWISFAGFKAKNICDMVNLTAQQPVYHPTSDDIKCHMKGLLSISENALCAEFSALAILFEVFSSLTDERCTVPAIQEHCTEKYVYIALQYIEQHYCEQDLYLEKVSQQANISPNYLSTIFKEQTGQTMTHYINSLRIAKACKMLENKQDSIQNIAFQVGFVDSHYFSRIFKKHMRCSPSKYMAHVKEVVKK